MIDRNGIIWYDGKVLLPDVPRQKWAKMFRRLNEFEAEYRAKFLLYRSQGMPPDPPKPELTLATLQAAWNPAWQFRIIVEDGWIARADDRPAGSTDDEDWRPMSHLDRVEWLTIWQAQQDNGYAPVGEQIEWIAKTAAWSLWILWLMVGWKQLKELQGEHWSREVEG